jgi:hypothetical protein
MSDKHWDLLNMIIAFDESIKKLIIHLESGHPEKALMKAREIDSVLCRVKSHCGEWSEKELINRI